MPLKSLPHPKELKEIYVLGICYHSCFCMHKSTPSATKTISESFHCLAEVPVSSPGPQFGLTEHCVTTAFRRGGPPSKNLVDSSVQQNNRFLAVMHSAAVVLLIYQRTRNVWRRMWEVESGQMSAHGQIAMAAAQLPPSC